jgi:hypothetical protein
MHARAHARSVLFLGHSMANGDGGGAREKRRARLQATRRLAAEPAVRACVCARAWMRVVCSLLARRGLAGGAERPGDVDDGRGDCPGREGSRIWGRAGGRQAPTTAGVRARGCDCRRVPKSAPAGRGLTSCCRTHARIHIVLNKKMEWPIHSWPASPGISADPHAWL